MKPIFTLPEAIMLMILIVVLIGVASHYIGAKSFNPDSWLSRYFDFKNEDDKRYVIVDQTIQTMYLASYQTDKDGHLSHITAENDTLGEIPVSNRDLFMAYEDAKEALAWRNSIKHRTLNTAIPAEPTKKAPAGAPVRDRDL